MKLKSYSKINLSLKVLRKKASGMHDIQSNSILVNLNDEIFIKKSNLKYNKVIFKGSFSKYVNKSNNSVLKVVKYLEEKNIFKNKYKFTIIKNIPVYSGLGGGTSNAATILRHFIKKKLTSKTINNLSKTIGSDYQLFLNNQSFQSSLKKVIPYKKKHNLNLIVVFPNKLCSTKKIYSKVYNYSLPGKNNFGNILSTKKYINLISREKNDLQPIVEKKYPVVRQIIEFLNNQKYCVFSRMTGSGSACFGVFLTKEKAYETLRKVRRKFPFSFSVITKTI
ncbi:MAG: hypothetical protein CBD76_01230 [Pelagibacteraceae bacterium TMED216]|nr:MAG: hypothetical protein CBD76_01230 [Pelagibacteraceae bacterium TMED216]|tara:strand:- start:51 stop:887 length:837 start_codon:yes stop_codon:yes gene_type:complete